MLGIAMNIREARKAKGITMKELGLRVGATESAISLYERGKREPSYQTLLMIAEELDTTVAYLLGAETKKEPAAPAGSELSADERAVIDIYRQLDDEGRRLGVKMMKALLSEHAQKNSAPVVDEVTA